MFDISNHWVFRQIPVIHFNGYQIDTLDILDPYQIPLIDGMKDTYVNVKAKLDDGTYVIIEM
jgi:hypothetical protein